MLLRGPYEKGSYSLRDPVKGHQKAHINTEVWSSVHFKLIWEGTKKVQIPDHERNKTPTVLALLGKSATSVLQHFRSWKQDRVKCSGFS